MNEDRKYLLIEKSASGRLTASEQAELRQWLDASEQNRAEYEEISQLLDLAAAPMNDSVPDVDLAWQEVASGMLHQLKAEKAASEPNKGWLLHRSFPRYAAAAVILLLVSTLFLFIDVNGGAVASYTTKPGERRLIGLTDGSQVFLNGGSTLILGEDFGAQNRDVSLEGEAFFEVAPNSESPFRIDAGPALVEVIGTEFNVNAYPEADAIEVEVEEGKVRLSGEGSGAELLTRNQSGSVNRKTGRVSRLEQFDSFASAWKENKLVFRDAEVSRALQKIGHYYGVTFILEKETSGQLFTSTLEETTLEEALEIIELVLQAEVVKENGSYKIREQKMQ